jgi:methylenetetrahydrofolate reductase (NADPH)
VARLARLDPEFVSVTYGAGGSSQERSCGTVQRIAECGLSTAAHLTCAGASRRAVADVIGYFRDVGIERFVALRGDPAGGLTEPYRPDPAGFQDTGELVRALKEAGARDVSVSAYPERHPQSPDWGTEIATLKRKVDAGADRAITQFFFDNDVYEAYLERVRRAGVTIPIVPGIMPIHRVTAIRTFAGRCGTAFPESLARRFADAAEESDAHTEIAAEVAAEQMLDLMRRGVSAFHLYTLNRAELTEAVCRACGIGGSLQRAAA